MPNSNKKSKDSGILGRMSSYAANVAKEYSQWANQGPNHPARNAESGQYWGALLQGRRYDDKTGKQITGKSKNASPKTKLNPVTESSIPRWQDSRKPMIKLKAPKK